MTSKVFRSRHTAPFLLITAWFAFVAVAVESWHDVPLIDDWTYAWSVEHFMQTGRLDILDWTATYIVLPTLWGTLWTTALGWSFGALRLSTLVLAIVACGSLYVLLLELGTSRRVAVFGALSLAVNPAFVFYASSFMTEVPFTTFTLLALLSYVRAMRGEVRHLWFAGLWSVAAFLVRQIAIITPIAALPVLISWPSRTGSSRRSAVGVVGATWLVMFLVWAALRHVLGTTSMMERWTWNLYAQPSNYLAMNAPMFLVASVNLLPALLAAATMHGWWHRPWRVVLAGVVVGIVLLGVVGTIPQPLSADGTWTLHEVGGSRALVSGYQAATASRGVDWSVRGVGLLAAAFALMVWTRSRGPGAAAWWVFRELKARVFMRTGLLRRDGSIDRRDDGNGPSSPELRPEWAAARTPLLAYLAASLVLFNVLWMYNDRYSVPLLPILTALTLAGLSQRTASLRVPAIALAIFACIAVAGTRDAIRYNVAVRDVWRQLVDTGVPPSEIDAGYAWTGWSLYAHPEALAPGQTAREDVPWVTASRTTDFIIAKGPVDGYAVQGEHTWRVFPWSRVERLLVLKRTALGPF